ncbi:hypothetical protein [Jatrophihabitans sp.]|uniref:hypothetical protein n=1 Tax=Jatrophihabitans sp. TaxID=1932789 RepID=UPI0030C6AB2C|nr:hypothetical protein [Jatrophihabitans sp.]
MRIDIQGQLYNYLYIREGHTLERELTEPVKISAFVRDKRGHVRWVVLATFVAAPAAEPVCVDYRVHVVRERPGAFSSQLAADKVLYEMQQDVQRDGRKEVWIRESVGPVGIPRRVFEEASQAKLLTQARTKLSGEPNVVDEFWETVAPGRRASLTEALTGRGAPSKAGRPPSRSLSQKLEILRSIEDAFAGGRTLDDVARDQHMSRSAIRNLLFWARHTVPPLFSSTLQGRRGGELTAHARALLAGTEVEDD